MSRPHKTPSRPVRKAAATAARSKGATDPRLAANATTLSASPDVTAFIARSAALYRKGQIRAALESATQGLAIEPDNAVLLSHRGVFAAALGDAAAAEADYRRAIAMQPDSAETHYNLGNLLKAQQRPEEAEAAYRRAIAVNPDSAAAHSNLGNLLTVQQRPEEAEALCRRAIALRPDYAEAYSNLGNLLQAQKRSQEAEAAYRRALALKPDYAEACSNLGVLLKAQKRVEEAEAAYLRAIAVKPDYAEAYSNFGVLLMALKRTEESEAAYRRAIALKPGHADAHWNLSLLLLRQGRFQEGWMEFEARYAPGKTDRKMAPPSILPSGPPLPPQWQGDALTGKALLIWPEQGLGDEIQFVRYLPLLKARGLRHLTLACKPPLKALFSAQGLADRVISTADWRPEMAAEFDYWCYPLSLPLHFATIPDNIPATIPYLRAEPDRIAHWAKRLPQAALCVGLVWKGSPTHRNDANRSLPSLAVLAPLWSVSGIAFVSLQKGAGEDEASDPPATQPLIHLGGEMADFADSAAMLSRLDLLICVDTAVAHLAGALGVPCWALLPDHETDWRWLEERSDSPWYPRVMRLFRQASDGDWDSVVARVVEALEEWLAVAGSADSSVVAGDGLTSPVQADVGTFLAESAALHRKGKTREALAVVTQALAIVPDNAALLNNQGVMLRAQGRPEEAEAAYRRAISLRPDAADAQSNLGNLLKAQLRPREAEAAYRRAIAANRECFDAYYNLGILLKEQKRMAEGEAAFRCALAIKPDHADARFDLGLLLLRMGRFEEGWRDYEARYAPGKTDRKAESPPISRDGPSLPPQWQGESATDQSMLVWAEQGLGDEIQFVRYLPLLRARGLKHVTLACKSPLKTLFAAQNLADRVIDELDWRPEMAAEFDFWCYLLSLPLHFGTTLKNIPATIPYLRVGAESIARWATRLPPATLRVGLVWKGRATHGNDAYRSLPSLATLAPLWSIPDIAFVSLQKGAGEDEAGLASANLPLTHLGAEMSDFADSAAILSQLDLLICVDTAVAHLAGALGVPCWVLLPDRKTDWRWLEERSDSPWYPRVMRLFRQASDGDWSGVMERVTAALKVWMAGSDRTESAALPIATMTSTASRFAPGWQLFGRNTNLQTAFDVAVVMPTIGRDCILDAVRSVYAQQNAGRIQLLIGVDVPRGDFVRLYELLEAAPEHVTPCLFYPGYSTSQRHGGLHPAFDGGVLRTQLSYLANARYLAYLDDDNWWSPEHLHSLLDAVQGRKWAFSLRWFVHPESRQPVCVDEWESVGPGRGAFLPRFGGWVDPNCLLIDKLACEPVLRWWGIPLPGDERRMSADRHVYDWLQKQSVPGETGLASVYYLMQADDTLHPRRLDRMGSRYAAAGLASDGLLSSARVSD